MEDSIAFINSSDKLSVQSHVAPGHQFCLLRQHLRLQDGSILLHSRPLSLHSSNSLYKAFTSPIETPPLFSSCSGSSSSAILPFSQPKLFVADSLPALTNFSFSCDLDAICIARKSVIVPFSLSILISVQPIDACFFSLLWQHQAKTSPFLMPPAPVYITVRSSSCT